MTEWNTNPVVVDGIYYPDSDGKPMAEGDVQRDYLIYLIEALQVYFTQQPDVYVSGNLLVYYGEGDVQSVVAPDVFVVFGVEKKQRMNYLVWREGKAPDIVIEITSTETYQQDVEEKFALYRDLGVREYVLYDPMDECMFPVLQGWRLNVAGEYEPIVPQSQNGYLVLVSEVLGLELHQDALRFRVYDPVNREYLRSHEEIVEDIQRIREERRRDEEARRVIEQIIALEEELRRMREQGLE